MYKECKKAGPVLSYSRAGSLFQHYFSSCLKKINNFENL